MLRKGICFFVFIIIILSIRPAQALELDIALFYKYDITAVTIESMSGNYRLKGDYDHLGYYQANQKITLQADNNKVLIIKGDSVIGKYRAIAFRGENFMNNFQIDPHSKAIKSRIYDDDLKVLSQNGYLRIINHVGLEHYVAGVVQSEGGGSSKDVEFYQVQAITCRTYALNNHRKHLDEGFNLCDDVHCQVYKGKAVNSDILLATMRTSGEVIVDDTKKMISASFHSNCGGQTMNSEDVWSIPTPYLKSVKDTFCRHMPNATWTYSMPKSKWLKYLQKKYDYDISKPGALDSVLIFEQNERKRFLAPNIPLKTIRYDLNLKSAFFDIHVKNNTMVFKGRGYGHGVGLCQEGAINMAHLGYSYRDIIHYYYRNVQIVNYHKLPYLLDELLGDSDKTPF